ncbi:Tannase/feruloyl esterase [Aspergillus fruticulosus]
MITWHGLPDEAIPPEGTIAYYQEVLKRDRKAPDFFRFLEVPEVGHWYGGLGPIPKGVLNQLIDWVEKGAAPDTLHADNRINGTARNVCPYPLQQVYIGGDPSKAESFACSRNCWGSH